MSKVWVSGFGSRLRSFVVGFQGFDLLDKTPFLNAFGIKSLDDIPSRSDDYGLGYVPRGAK